MSKFKVGDKVVANKEADDWYFWTHAGWEGEVKEILDPPNINGDIIVVGKGQLSEKEKFLVWSDYFDLKKSDKPHKPEKPKAAGKPKRTVVIEITDDGADAKYLNGKKVEKTASIRRYYKDRPDDLLAAVYAVERLFGLEPVKGKDIFADIYKETEISDLRDAIANAGGYLNDAKVVLGRITAGKK